MYVISVKYVYVIHLYTIYPYTPIYLYIFIHHKYENIFITRLFGVYRCLRL